MKKKKILLQCQGIVYYYMGLAAIYTKYPDRNVEVDVLFSSAKNGLILDEFTEKIRKSKYAKNVYSVFFNRPYIYDKMLTTEKNIVNTIKYHFIYKYKLIKGIKSQIKLKNNYSEIFFSHEQGNMLITSLKILYPKANFVAYGDGSGLISGRKYKASVKVNKDYKFFKEIVPDEIICLLAYMFDESIDIKDVPINATDKELLKGLIINDTAVQNEINDYTDEILDKYSDCEKNILLTSQLDNELYLMSSENQIKVYADIIDKYCSDGSLLILKTHPAADKTFLQNIIDKCHKNVTIIELPKYLSKYPIEVFYKLLMKSDRVITFVSSSKLSLSYTFGIDCTEAYDIIEKYPMKHYSAIILDAYKTIFERILQWDKKSLIYKDNIRPRLEQIVKYNKNYPDGA